MDKKVHYKMHKVKKQWVTIAVTGMLRFQKLPIRIIFVRRLLISSPCKNFSTKAGPADADRSVSSVLLQICVCRIPDQSAVTV